MWLVDSTWQPVESSSEARVSATATDWEVGMMSILALLVLIGYYRLVFKVKLL